MMHFVFIDGLAQYNQRFRIHMTFRYWSVASAVLLSAIYFLGFTTTTLAAETYAEHNPDLPEIQSLRPPLPGFQPQIGPSDRSQPQQISVLARSLAGHTGYGYGASKIGRGREVLANADDMDARSTVFDLSLVTVPESFVFPDVLAGERWIRVDLGNQQVVAYEGEESVRAFVVSTGLPSYPTVTGEFRIRMKVSEQTMSGDGYYLPGVKWVQYFYEEYGFHGTYWHEDFGIPKSHGCVNMTNADAKWLFDWAGPVWDQETVWFRSTSENPGTLVLVHE